MNSNKSRVLLYTDGPKIEFATSAVTFAPIRRNWSSIINNFDLFIEKRLSDQVSYDLEKLEIKQTVKH